MDKWGYFYFGYWSCVFVAGLLDLKTAPPHFLIISTAIVTYYLTRAYSDWRAK